MLSISVLMKPASAMCNMDCKYCFYCDETKKRDRGNYGFMSEETLKNVIRKTMSHAEKSISYAYQGGEPTLRGLDFFRQAVKYQKQYNKYGINVSNALQTNGYAIDEEWCQFLKENHFLVGISVDGTETLHNAYRRDRQGEGTYQKVLHSIKLLEQYGVDYNILTVVNGKIAKHAEEIYENYRSHGWHYQQYIACLEPLGERWGMAEYALLPEAYGDFLIRLFRLWYADWREGNQPYIRQFENYIGILLGYRPESCDQCGACGIQYVVEADGSVYPCDFYMLDEYLLGNFNEHRLEHLDKNREECGFLKQPSEHPEGCRICQFKAVCKEGCRRYWVPGDATGRYENYFCEAYKLFFRECLPYLQEMVLTLV